jgi:flavin-dependent dehydrogenase
MSDWSGDVVVVGAGPAGSACATFLARSGCRVLLVDDGNAGGFRPPEILSPQTRRLLREHDLATPESLRSSVICHGVEGCWGGDVDYFDYALMACEPALAVDRTEFDAMLVDGALAAGAEQCSGKLLGAACSTEGWVATVSQAGQYRTVEALVLVDAVGRSRKPISYPTRRLYFDTLCGLALPLQCTPQHCTTMALEAGSNGWWYLSLDGSGKGAVVYMTDTDLLPTGSARREEAFRRELAATRLMASRAGPLPGKLELIGLDARTSRRQTLEVPRGFAVGDAAYGVDPLSGAGIQRSIDTAARAADNAIRYMSGDTHTPGAYARWADEDFGRWLWRKNLVYADAKNDQNRGAFWSRRFERLAARQVHDGQHWGTSPTRRS